MDELTGLKKNLIETQLRMLFKMKKRMQVQIAVWSLLVKWSFQFHSGPGRWLHHLIIRQAFRTTVWCNGVETTTTIVLDSAAELQTELKTQAQSGMRDMLSNLDITAPGA